ncbi:MAG: sigma-54-dependent Fis family transcriptional regulator [Bacteroidales bacterium]|nr:sigma-54-dependent Fis family transcriptional regulator [Bacteroidales bacterium]
MLSGRILVVDDNKNALSALKMLLQIDYELVVTLANPNLVLAELEKDDFDIVLLDMNFSAGINTGNEGLYWLCEIKKKSPTTEVVMITAYGDVELAVKALKNGAADFILKPWENEKLLATLQAALKLRRSNVQVEELKQREHILKKGINQEQRHILGSSPGILSMMQTIAKVAKTDANVLITGENGTGKELVALEIHRRSERNNELLVSVDMGAIPETLFESELFGHKKGAFTDAREDRMGKFQLAHRGTLFLDEIGNLPFTLQSKLLTTLQSRTVIPIGSNQPIPIDIRLICATNCDVEQLVEQQKFREDLLYRINTIRIEVPPLRERGGDIELLAKFFLAYFEKKYRKPSLKISSQAMRKLMEYPWPGNVRELQHTIEKAVILSDSGNLKPDDFVFKSTGKLAGASFLTLDEMEKYMIKTALDRHKGKHSAVAHQLGISRQTLYNKIKRYDL